ncbi:hypothetical protein FSP39_013028 [Pinctada imbricata]|uniref:Nucleoplasmin core domain-containing protein n=1 Tax=Pinctada imbricata TaxID=66713 RepID=A0AA88Y6B8_PINIB|nr:hypothetical protein FSP39_013028 [Pinctada imbricata]
MCNLDVSFGHEVPVIFRLTEGSGPVHISAQQLVGMYRTIQDPSTNNVFCLYGHQPCNTLIQIK